MKIDKEVVKEYLRSFIQAVVIFIILYIVFWPMGIDGGSMSPELNDSDRVVISRILLQMAPLNRGDVVICRLELDGKKENIVKRIIGVPGDHIVISEGILYVNDEVLTEDYITTEIIEGDTNIFLNDGEYFIMGDNRDISRDSRCFGPLDASKITGKVILKWYPLNDIKIY